MNSIIYLLVAFGSLLLAIQNGRSLNRYTASGSFVILCSVAFIGFSSFGLHLIWAPSYFHFVYPMMAALIPATLMGFLVRWLEIPEHKADNVLWGLGLSVGAIFVTLKYLLDFQDGTVGLPEYLISIWFFGSC